MQRKFYDVRKLARIASTAIAEGYGKIVADGHVKLSDPDCEGLADPKSRQRWSLYSRGGITSDGVRIRPLTVSGAWRCRKCNACKEGRSKMWIARAIDEFNRWPRTMFGTFTLSPENHDFLDNLSRHRLARGLDVKLKPRLKGPCDFDGLSQEEKLQERVSEFGAVVTRWLKVVRQGHDGHTKTLIRYLLVAEVHDSDRTSDVMRGRPHFHILIHEIIAGSAVKGSPLAAITEGGDRLSCSVAAGEWEQRMVRGKDGVWRPHAFVRDEAFIRKNWTLGHCKFQWAEDAKSAYYVCKYVSKTLLGTRVRCSKKYGKLTSLPRSPSL